MHSTELPLAFLILMFSNTSENCMSRLHITAVEGEPFYLKYCRSSSEHKNEKNTRWCYQPNGSLEQIELNPSNSPRIAFHEYALEFWPVELSDSGSYFLKMGNDTHEWKLNVIRRNKHNCFTEKQVNTRTVEVKKHLMIKCETPYYRKLINKTSLYKNCEQIEIRGNTFEKNAEFEDQGYYTCVFSLHYNGKLFNVTKTFNVTIAGDYNSITPVLLGPKFNQIEVELGKSEQLNCSALLNKDDTVYWNFRKENETDHNLHEEQEIKIKTSEGKWHASRILRIENINENNLNFLYNCTLASKGGTDVRVFILVRKGIITGVPRLYKCTHLGPCIYMEEALKSVNLVWSMTLPGLPSDYLLSATTALSDGCRTVLSVHRSFCPDHFPVLYSQIEC
ncbi:interleukin-18 receptor 1 isoform X5 [Trichechus manatus latirostris]|uniref:Interleukin-18 receptor 1 n=1 Tax=Trichechus manatus latirostris TaxID=127582 RepID=A0A2Y9R896_TRIMA|nr:interleukin-18 receptor 1 isoform X5 [Trichechus manatus latirostris]